MAWTAKFLVPFRQSFSQSRHLFNGKIRPLKTWVHIFEPKLQSRASKFEYMLNIQRKYVQDCCFSGSRHMRSIFGASVMLGAVYCWSHISHAMDGLDIFSDDNHLESFDASEVITRILLFLLSTKPSPSSIYLFIEKLCYGYMRQKPHFYKCKALHASKVEVQDYKLFCLAIVEIGDEKIRLIGILGGWWSLPSSLGLYFLAPEQSSSSSL
ncbi:hypothetical protein ERO13_A10G102700v2 [Gossypium hirsutum]|uniref:Uncharacterized protein isoform X3 n=1 Tax=Gossypium hirsutum TaxID=3635 RepID=A0A1U8IQ57_GOSHI|nr:uncharacterized protein LOC107897566 isoform X3 [Gossypium hirsutum]XP_040934910.1 uncharacterized protein LOC107897566 isoform X3 [Gossypium hirsutum]XP_040934911.1 uncharacterized protein LOC107897566 isoform X3 [Gossypium hirsutum]KAG4179360.1 hypothetical protein ERO13_A10G102700v2 [Gossypium hirsutum]